MMIMYAPPTDRRRRRRRMWCYNIIISIMYDLRSEIIILRIFSCSRLTVCTNVTTIYAHYYYYIIYASSGIFMISGCPWQIGLLDDYNIWATATPAPPPWKKPKVFLLNTKRPTRLLIYDGERKKDRGKGEKKKPSAELNT